MNTIAPIVAHPVARTVLVAAALLLAGCADRTPTAPASVVALRDASSGQTAQDAQLRSAVETMRRVTARYHNLTAATDDGFLLLHPCESRPGEGPVGIVYYHPTRLMDGVADVASPDALIYEPRANGKPRLVGVEFAVLNTGQAAPTLLGQTFQAEDEFGVYALHAWVWRQNPEGLFAETNPRVSCE